MMEPNEAVALLKKAALLLIGVMVVMLVSGILGGKIGYDRGMSRCVPQIEHDTIVKDTTIWMTRDSLVPDIRYIPKYYPVAVHDTLFPDDTTDVELPYIEAFTEIPDTLKIWYHGWVDVGIDSVKFGAFQKTETIHETVIVPKVEMPPFSVNAGIGVMRYDKTYGYAKASVSYNRKYSTWTLYGGYGTDFNGMNKPIFGAEASFRLDF